MKKISRRKPLGLKRQILLKSYHKDEIMTLIILLNINYTTDFETII